MLKDVQVYPERSRIIHLDEPLGEVANAVRDREMAMRRKLGDIIDEDEVNDVAMQTCLGIARQKLEEQLGDCGMTGPDGIKHLLISQRHLHKKGIMFTAFVFSIIIADLLGLEFVWSSDCKCATRLAKLMFGRSKHITPKKGRKKATKKIPTQKPTYARMRLDTWWHTYVWTLVLDSVRPLLTPSCTSRHDGLPGLPGGHNQHHRR